MRDMLGREIKKHDVIAYATRRGSHLTQKIGVVTNIPMMGVLKVRGAKLNKFGPDGKIVELDDTPVRYLDVDTRIGKITNTHAVIVLDNVPDKLKNALEGHK